MKKVMVRVQAGNYEQDFNVLATADDNDLDDMVLYIADAIRTARQDD